MESSPVRKVGAGQKVTTAVHAELDDIEKKARQTPPGTRSFTGHRLINITPDAQELEGSATMALPMKTGAAIVAIP